MAEQIYTYRDSTYNPQQAYYYDLLILIENNSFSCSVVYNEHLLAYEANCALSELTGPDKLKDILSADYKSVVIGLTASGFSLIPAAIFDTEHSADFARLLDVKTNEKVLAQVLDSKNHVVYKVDEKLLAYADGIDSKKMVFGAKGWIKTVALSKPLNTQLFVNVINGTIEFLYFKDGNLRFYNLFEFFNEDDAIYYAALVTKELDIQQAETTLIISGIIDLDYQLYRKFLEFFANVVLSELQPVQLPDVIAPHQILSLTGLILCGSSAAL